MIIHSCLSKMKNKILSTCFQGNYIGSLGEFSNTSFGVFGVEGVKLPTVLNEKTQDTT